MHLKPINTNRQLSAYDEQQIEKLLDEAYGTSEFTAKGYSYPMNDNRLLLDYVINFFGTAESVRFFRKAYKKDGQWRLSTDFKAVKFSDAEVAAADIEELINTYMED